MAPTFPPPLTVSKALSRDLDALLERTLEGEDARQKLGELLQAALQLEFATIAPYLSAAFSLSDENEAIQRLIVRVAKEEMLHMAAVANLMNAIGLPPDIIRAVPEYPFDLNAIEPPLHLELKSFSPELVEDLFMKIEAPEDPVEFPVVPTTEGVDDRPKTIGQFYTGIIRLIESDTIPDLFVNAERDAYKQIEPGLRFDQAHDRINYLNNQENGEYPLKADINFLIKDKESAVRHLAWIISEGEGAEKFKPLGPEGIPGHYYRFESILKSRYLIKDATVALRYSYSGGGLVFSSEGVHEFDPNAKVEDYAAFPQLETQMKRFNEKYTAMIDGLHIAFNCPAPEQQAQSKAAYEEAVSAMRDLTGISGRIIAKAKLANVKAGIPFQYKPNIA